MKHFTTSRPVLDLARITLLISLLVLPALRPLQAAKILYVVNSFSDPNTTANANDQEVRDRLVSQGHTVTLADDDTVSAADTTGIDLVLISSSVGSAAAGVNPLSKNTLRTGLIPVVCYEPGLYDELLLQTATTFGNANGHTSIGIVSTNKTHALAAGKSGVIDIVDAGNSATISSSALPLTLGNDAIIIATNATPGVDEGRICFWAHEVGSRLADNSTVVPSRRVALFYNATTAAGVYNTNATDLLDAAIKWALQPPAVVPVSITSRTPASQDTGVVPDTIIQAKIEDGSAQLATNSVKLSLYGTLVTPSVVKTGAVTTVTFAPPSLFPPGSVQNVSLLFSDTANKSYTNVWLFTVAAYVTLPPSLKAPAGAIDLNKPGFTLKLRQMSGARPGGSTINTVRAQLEDTLIDPSTGQPFTDSIDRTQTGFTPAGSKFNPDGSFTEAGVIN